jgi:dual specificity protein kinase YAK1
MSNRVAFIDFVRGLLNINPLERWSPQQAKLHPFITQQKFDPSRPFVPPMNLKSPSNKPPAPGVQQQLNAEAMSKQRAAQAAQVQAQAQAQAQNAAQTAYAMQVNQYGQLPHGQPPPPVYNNMYPAHAQPAPPPYPTHNTGYAPQMGQMPQQQGQMAPAHYGHQATLYQQATQRAGRQRASTMDQQQGGIPAAIQRVASHLDPSQPIRLQPSPAYYPPPPDGYVDSSANTRRRGSRNQRNRDFIRTLEDGAMGQAQWH